MTLNSVIGGGSRRIKPSLATWYVCGQLGLHGYMRHCKKKNNNNNNKIINKSINSIRDHKNFFKEILKELNK